MGGAYMDRAFLGHGKENSVTKVRREGFRLTEEAANLLRQEAERRGISKTAVIEQAIRAYTSERTAEPDVTRRKGEK